MTRLVLIGALLTACSDATAPSSGEPITTPPLDQVAVIVMENKEYGDVIGSPDAPFINELATDYSNAERMFGILHPSLPNYIALLSGNTQGITATCTDCVVDAPNLVDQLEEAGISWNAYMGGMTEPCGLTDQGTYVVRHNPFVYFESVRNDPERCSKVVPFSELGADIEGNDLPRFIWITPDLCNGTHDCPVAQGDDYLATLVPALIDAMSDRSIVIITYDEGTSDEGCCDVASGGHIPTVVAGPAAYERTRSTEAYTLYSVLRTIEEAFGLPLLGAADCDCTLSLGGFVEPKD